MNVNEVFVINQAVKRYEVGGETALHDELNQKVHVLNGTALLIWEKYASGSTVADVVEKLSSYFNDISVDTLRSDAESATEELLELGLIRRQTDPLCTT